MLFRTLKLIVHSFRINLGIRHFALYELYVKISYSYNVQCTENGQTSLKTLQHFCFKIFEVSLTISWILDVIGLRHYFPKNLENGQGSQFLEGFAEKEGVRKRGGGASGGGEKEWGSVFERGLIPQCTLCQVIFLSTLLGQCSLSVPPEIKIPTWFCVFNEHRRN